MSGRDPDRRRDDALNDQLGGLGEFDVCVPLASFEKDGRASTQGAGAKADALDGELPVEPHHDDVLVHRLARRVDDDHVAVVDAKVGDRVALDGHDVGRRRAAHEQVVEVDHFVVVLIAVRRKAAGHAEREQRDEKGAGRRDAPGLG